jgi:serine/threonine protein kinase
MSSSTKIFLNQDAKHLDELHLDHLWTPKKIYDNIFSIQVDNSELDWLIKTYANTKHAKCESNILKCLKKVSGVPKVLAVGLSPGFNYIIMSKAPGEDLHNYITNHGVCSEEKARQIMKKTLRILKQIHRAGIVHRDIKPENIIYDHISNIVTLIDFEGKETEDYRSPEQIINEKITFKTDLWSLGATLYVILTDTFPFRSEKHQMVGRIKYYKHWSTELKDFLNCLIEPNPKMRYSTEDALEHSWICSKPI